MSRSLLMFLVSLVIWVAITSEGHAVDTPRWVFVPVLVGDGGEGQVKALVAPLEQGLERGHVEFSVAAAATLEMSHSSEPVRLDDEQLARTLRIVGEGMRLLAFGKREEAQAELQPLESLAGPVRDYLQRVPERAQVLFDACVTTADLLIHEKKLKEAQEHMIGCVRTFPGYEPRKVSAKLRRSFKEAVAVVERAPHGMLVVRGGSAECAVRVNGIELAKSPATLRLPRGIARVQLECAPEIPGRVHAVTVGGAGGELAIDPEFDGAVHSREALWLSYGDAERRGERMDADAAALAAILEPKRIVLLVHDATANRVTVRAMGQDIVTVPFADGSYKGTAVRTIAERLEPLMPAPHQSPGPAPMVQARLEDEPSDPFLARQSRETSRAVRIAVGISSVVVGAVGFGVGWAMYAQRYSLRSKLYFGDVPYDVLEQYDHAAVWGSLGAAVGATGWAAGGALLLPKARGVPTSAWVLGGAGAAIGMAAAGFAIFGDHCQPRVEDPCSDFTADELFAPLLALHALPLMAVPVIYAVRPAPGRLELRMQGSMLSLRGTF